MDNRRIVAGLLSLGLLAGTGAWVVAHQGQPAGQPQAGGARLEELRFRSSAAALGREIQLLTGPLPSCPGLEAAQISPMRKTALLAFAIGMALGCLFGAAMGFLPKQDEGLQRATLSVNQVSGRPQIHIRGKPEIK